MQGRCGGHNSQPASFVMDFTFCRPDSYNVSVGTVYTCLGLPILQSTTISRVVYTHACGARESIRNQIPSDLVVIKLTSGDGTRWTNRRKHPKAFNLPVKLHPIFIIAIVLTYVVAISLGHFICAMHVVIICSDLNK